MVNKRAQGQELPELKERRLREVKKKVTPG